MIGEQGQGFLALTELCERLVSETTGWGKRHCGPGLVDWECPERLDLFDLAYVRGQWLFPYLKGTESGQWRAWGEQETVASTNPRHKVRARSGGKGRAQP